MLLDTSGLLCLHYRGEPYHAQAVEAYRAAQMRLTHGHICHQWFSTGLAAGR